MAIQPCGGGECCPNTFIGLCLADGTPIAIVLQNNLPIGWTNLLTGIFTPGSPPPGTIFCDADSGSGDTEDQILCDVDNDGNIIATVLVSRVYDEFGVPGLPSFWDPETGDPYIVQGDLEVCPLEVTIPPISGLELVTRDTETHIVCDVDGSGNLIAHVLVAITFDEDGNITDGPNFFDPFTGDPYVVVGTLENCCCDEIAISGIVNIRPLDCDTDFVTVCQGTTPWVVTVSGAAPVEPLDCEKDSVTVCQGTDPWIVSGTVDIEGPVTVTGVDFDIRPLTCETDAVTACQGTDPWIVSGAGPGGAVVVHLDDCVCITGTIETNPPVTEWALNATSAANTAVAVTRPADPGLRHYITGILLGYDVSPTTGKTYTLVSGGTLIDQFVDENWDWLFPIPIQCPFNTAVTLTLGAGGINVFGKVTLMGFTA